MHQKFHKWFKSLTLLLLAGWTLTPVFALEPGTVVTVEANRLNMRAKPIHDAEVVAQVDFGTELVLKGGSHSNFVEIVPPVNISFWVSSAYVKDGVVTAKKLNVRSGASVNHAVVGQVLRREQLQQRGAFNEWLEIAPPSQSSLWVSRDYLFMPAPAVPEPPVAEKPLALPVPVAPAPTPVPPKTAPLTTMVPAITPTPTPVPPSEEVKLVPLPGQGKIVRREGRLRSYLLKGNSPSKYYLSANLHGAQQLICYVENDGNRLRSYRGKNVIIQGHEYWVQGVSRPVIVPKAIIVK